jgi:hypothetical protein
VRYIGGSNFSGWHMMKSLAVSDRYGYPRHVAHQIYYSLLNRDYEWELMPLAEDQGVGAMVWSPLGWGKLTGKIRRGQPAKPGTRAHDIAGTGPHFEEERLFRIVDALDVVAEQTGKTIPQVALNWLLNKKTISSVIIGARDEQQLIDNIGATGWSLTAEQIALLETASDVAAAYPVWHQRGLPDAERAALKVLALKVLNHGGAQRARFDRVEVDRRPPAPPRPVQLRGVVVGRWPRIAPVGQVEGFQLHASRRGFDLVHPRRPFMRQRCTWSARCDPPPAGAGRTSAAAARRTIRPLPASTVGGQLRRRLPPRRRMSLARRLVAARSVPRA